MWITPNQLYNTVGQIKGYVDNHSGGGGITEKVLWTGQADTINTPYSFTEDISGYDYLYVKGNIGAVSPPFIYTTISKISDLMDSSGNYTGTMSLMFSTYSASSSQISAKRTSIQLINSLSFKVTGLYDSTASPAPIIPTEIIGWKFNSGSGSGASVTNYSLKEQEVGTWVDGSVLYEKTYEFNVPVATENQLRQISLPLNDVDNLIAHPFIVGGFIQMAQSPGSTIYDGASLGLNTPSSVEFPDDVLSTSWIEVVKVEEKTTYKAFINISGKSSQDLMGIGYLTIRYTKSLPSPTTPEKPESLEAAT